MRRIALVAALWAALWAATGWAAPLARATFKDVHEALVRLTANEAGTDSESDADGIFRSITARCWRGGKLDLDCTMSRFVRHSTRTFPIDSHWRVLVKPTRLRFLDKLRTPRNAWTSALTLECHRPTQWNDVKPWSVENCFNLVDTTRDLLTGKKRSQCKRTPFTWGNAVDLGREQAKAKGWVEVICDRYRARVPGNTVDCVALRAAATPDNPEGRKQLANTRECAKNTFLIWRRHPN